MTHTSRNFICDTEIRELGEDHALVDSVNEALALLDSRLDLLRMVGNSARSRSVAHEFYVALGEIRNDASWPAHVVGCELAAQESKPVKIAGRGMVTDAEAMRIAHSEAAE